MGWEVSTKGAQQLRELSARIKETGGTDGTMLRKFRSEIRQAGGPCIADLRSAVMGVKVSRSLDEHSRRWDSRLGQFVMRSDLKGPRVGRWGRRSTGLRARVAGSLGISQTKRGIRIRASATKIGPYGKSLPRYLDGSVGRYDRWRHPVFGNREVWVQQKGQPWFFVTITKHRASFRKAVFDVLEQTKQELSR